MGVSKLFQPRCESGDRPPIVSRNRPSSHLAAQPCARPRNGGIGHLEGQSLFVALYRGALRSESGPLYGSGPLNHFPKTSLNELDKVERDLNEGKTLNNWFSIRVYEPKREEAGKVVLHLRRNAPANLKNMLTIGVFDGHAFLIKDIEKLAKTYAFVHCRSRFTKAGNLQRHILTCAKGETQIFCQAKQIEALKTTFEQAFFSDKTITAGAANWIESEAWTGFTSVAKLFSSSTAARNVTLTTAQLKKGLHGTLRSKQKPLTKRGNNSSWARRNRQKLFAKQSACAGDQGKNLPARDSVRL